MTTQYILPFWVQVCSPESSTFNHPDLIRQIVPTMKYLICESFCIPILIHYGSKYLL